MQNQKNTSVILDRNWVKANTDSREKPAPSERKMGYLKQQIYAYYRNHKIF